ncbi:MAG: type II secretion system protein GspG [Microgenomates group bacterium]
MGRKNSGFTMIELLIVVATIGILGTMAIFTALNQIAKGRDGRRKADLAKIQKALEDYMNDNGCYPERTEITEDLPIQSVICKKSFSPYLTELPCDPINNTYYNYFYSYDSNQTCKSWYKIYAKLENTKDPIIAQAGCAGGCGPSGNYNYWVSSPNMNKVEQTAGELWWPPIAGVTPTLSPGVTPTPTPTLAPTPTLTPILTPTPTSTLPPGTTPTPTPISLPTPTLSFYGYYGCFSGVCLPIWGDCSTGNCECPNMNYMLPDCGRQCGTPENPQNQCY